MPTYHRWKKSLKNREEALKSGLYRASNGVAFWNARLIAQDHTQTG
jgi:hypothetical protein